MSAEDKIIPAADPKGQIVASMPRDQLRSMFYLFAGKPDSRIKVFDGALHLRPADMIELNACVVRKLKTHNIDASTSSIKVGYVGAEISEFGTWTEFENHHWQEPEKIEELVIKWDFLVNIQDYAAPQRHTLLFRVSSDIKPGKLLQLLSSGNSDDFDSEEMFSSPAFCRVDFINAQLSKELINVVHDWHKGRPSPKLIPSAYYWFKKRRQGLAEILDHWLVLSWALVVVSVMVYAAGRWYPAGVSTHVAAAACFFAIYSLGPARRVARGTAARVFNALRDIEGSRVVFDFTSGDRKRIAELQQENSKQGQRFLANAAWNILLNLVAGGIFAYLFTKGA
jgi:hypothetical protein